MDNRLKASILETRSLGTYTSSTFDRHSFRLPLTKRWHCQPEQLLMLVWKTFVVERSGDLCRRLRVFTSIGSGP